VPRYIVKFIAGEGVYTVWDTETNSRVEASSANSEKLVKKYAIAKENGLCPAFEEHGECYFHDHSTSRSGIRIAHIMTHSLTEAVKDHTILESSALEGLSIRDVAQLAIKYPEARVLVRLRSEQGDARTIMPSKELAAWGNYGASRAIGDPIVRTWMIDGKWWVFHEIRDVVAVAV
jgi:hypothetical protein